jgi:hypothetical protein
VVCGFLHIFCYLISQYKMMNPLRIGIAVAM